MRRLIPAKVRTAYGLLALSFVAALVLVPARPAAAHGTLAMAVPAPGATVSEPLTTVRLYFTEKVAYNAHLTVTSPAGGRVDAGWSFGEPRPLAQPVREYVLVDGVFEPREFATGFPAEITVAHLPVTGEYTVGYLSVASDGEPVRGNLTFRYAGPVTAAPAGWRPPTDQADPALLAAVTQHDSSGHRPGAATSPTASAVAAPSTGTGPAQTDGGDSGPPAWAGAGAVLLAALVGLLAWRHRTKRVGVPPVRRPRRAAPQMVSGSPNAGTSTRGGRASGRGRTDRRTHPSPTPAPPPAPPVAAASGPAAGSTRLALFVGGLVLALLAGFGLGRTSTGTATAGAGRSGGAAVPITTGPQEAAGDGHRHSPGSGPHTHPGDGAGPPPVAGFAVSADGYRLQPVQRSQPAGRSVAYQFRVIATDGRPVTRFVDVHDKPLHLVVVGRDLTGYQHLHPTMGADGTWSVPMTLTRPGSYRVYADFSVVEPDGTPVPLVLGVDHHVPGTFSPAAPPVARPHATAGPFTVTMTGSPRAGTTVPMAFGVGRDGTAGPVAVQRYLGAFGHLVVVREGDLGYVHAHPEPELIDGAISFWLLVPSTGRYRAFLDFQVDGTVHTAEYTIDVE
ncbi:copper resistance CopC family protein [Micromonospora marina]|uniref:copper resistance CopC family protein n=1 Tax=Micromonospora marina TaxID=307120 RepID=UPI00345725A5